MDKIRYLPKLYKRVVDRETILIWQVGYRNARLVVRSGVADERGQFKKSQNSPVRSETDHGYDQKQVAHWLWEDQKRLGYRENLKDVECGKNRISIIEAVLIVALLATILMSSFSIYKKLEYCANSGENISHCFIFDRPHR